MARSRRHTSQVKGSFEDSGKYIKCWNCGHINSSSLSGGTGDGRRAKNFNPDLRSPVCSGDPKLVTIKIDGYNMSGAIYNLELDGSKRKDYYEPRKATLNTANLGCKFCGCRNLS